MSPLLGDYHSNKTTVGYKWESHVERTSAISDILKWKYHLAMEIPPINDILKWFVFLARHVTTIWRPSGRTRRVSAISDSGVSCWRDVGRQMMGRSPRENIGADKTPKPLSTKCRLPTWYPLNCILSSKNVPRKWKRCMRKIVLKMSRVNSLSIDHEFG